MEGTIRPATSTAYSAVYQLIAWKRYKEALVETEKLLRDDPHDPDPYAIYAQIFTFMGEYEKAQHWAKEALSRDPEHHLGWYVRVSVYYETGNEKAFEKALQEALRINPYESHYYYLAANQLNKKGKFKEAKIQIVTALELDAENPQYLAVLSYIEALLGEAVESRRLDREAIRYGAEEPVVLMYLAWAAASRNEYKLQETYMRSAIRLNPDEKQYQDEYLESLRHHYFLYRICMWPNKLLRKMKPWQILLLWIGSWILFKPLVVVFIVLHILAHWSTRAIVHISVFGWRRRRT
ncbi:tetratricopeptide repeat protein [Paenibacillus lignilyticus]|uniref:Tetratricopeptide repeat protein n=1 Tax=Paenibacillus lignilyticus TaxID=1172615 RepID=A0ABS5CDT9_9BACL|nr:tetratricopeptide repeat protein [Paenibacillus lignilyticus]MBP3964083.1 tetratricopeptide repeat protein [Paenibacillus lignilyticus]